jgi:hypothetical protein
MSKPVSKKIDVFLSVNKTTVNDYFNPHDPAPIYKRQLRRDMIAYLDDAVHNYSRHAEIRYKISCTKGDKELVEPFMQAVRRHYQVNEQIAIKEFRKYKRRTFRLLFMSLAVVAICHTIPPLFLSHEGFGATIMNSIDCFSWVILWKPIDRLVFDWNSHLKEISLYNKLANSEVLVMEYADTAVEMDATPKLRASA